MEFKDFALDIAKRAGSIIKNNFGLGVTIQWKADNSPVSITDSSINELIIQSITEEFPSHSIRGEEASALKSGDYEWIVDPLDGTLLFSHGLHGSVFSLGLLYKGNPILAVVNDPFHNRLFCAEKGKGAEIFNNPYVSTQSKLIRVSKSCSLKGNVVSLELPPVDTILPYNQLALLSEGVLAKEARLLCFGSCIQIGSLVACGEFIGVVYSGTQPHDGATVKLLVEEAGGKVTDLYGDYQKYNGPIKGFIASNGLVHSELVEIVKKAL